MNSSKNYVLIGLCLLVLGGCSTILSCDDGRDVRWFTSPAGHMLNNGIKSYYDGDYDLSMKMLGNVVSEKNATSSQKVGAYKYMAFIHCVSSRDKLCRESFRKALEINPGFNLSLAEAGHPVWGPAFRSEKNMLQSGIKSYYDGDYGTSLAVLQNLVDNKDAAVSQKLEAYKYMAFSNCILSREKMCRESFQKALDLDSNFNLSPSEAGHPIWGPVFRSVKRKSKK